MEAIPLFFASMLHTEHAQIRMEATCVAEET